MLYNLHTHSQFCDGKEDMECFVKHAVELGFESLGFSGHSPLPFETYFSMKNDKLEDYAQEVNRLKVKYAKEIEIFTSLEIDYIPGKSYSFQEFKDRISLDYTIGSVHLIKGNNDFLWFLDGPNPDEYIDGIQKGFDNPEQAVRLYYSQLNQMIENEKPDIIAHIDKVKMYNRDKFFTEETAWYKEAFMETLELAKSTNTIIEVNTRGIYRKKSDKLFPGVEWLRVINELQIPILISADAHKSSELLSYVPETAKILDNIGFKSLMYFKNGDWNEVGIKEVLGSLNIKK